MAVDASTFKKENVMDPNDPVCHCGYRQSMHDGHLVPAVLVDGEPYECGEKGFKRCALFNLDLTPELENYLSSKPLRRRR